MPQRISRTIRALNRVFSQRAISRNVMDQLGRSVVETIKRRTQGRGLGVGSPGSSEKKLKGLSSSYKKWRTGGVAFRRDDNGNLQSWKPSKKPFLSPKTTSRRSNLTRTGQMFAGMIHRVTGKNSLLITFRGRRRNLDPFKRKKIERSNLKVAEFVSDDRPFMNLSKKEIENISDKFEKDITQGLRSALTRIR